MISLKLYIFVSHLPSNTIIKTFILTFVRIQIFIKYFFTKDKNLIKKHDIINNLMLE